MFLHQPKFIHSLLLTSLVSLGYADVDPSTWTGVCSSDMQEYCNWNEGVPYSRPAIFDGNGDNSPLSRREGGISFEEMNFTDSTDVSIITRIQVQGPSGVTVTPGVLANFDVYEHQHSFYPQAVMKVEAGSAGSGGGTVNYNLQGFGQLYAFEGADEDTIVNVIMTGTNNYFEIDGSGDNSFHNVSSNSEDDEISLFSGGNLIINSSESNTILGEITGEGSLTKSGTGTLILNNNNTYTGITQVNEGILELNGSVINGVFIGPLGTLKGTGNIGGSLISSGTISPGNSIGTLSAVNFLPESSNIVLAEITSTGLSDQIIATGSATLLGALKIIPLDFSFTAPQTYNILQTGTGITGTFSTVTTTVPALMSLTYGPNDLSLTYLPLSAIKLNSNAVEAADCFITLSSSDANEVSLELLSLTLPEIQTAFNQMQPSQFSAQTWTQLQNALLISSNYFKHLDEFSNHKNCTNQDRSHVWIDGVGQWQHQGSKQNQIGYHDWTAGVSLGTDTSYKDFHFGGAASYTYSDLHWKKSAGTGNINSYYGGLYGSWSHEALYVDFTALGAYSQYKTSRHIYFGDISRKAEASHHGWEALAGIEAGFYGEVKRFRIGPFGRVDYVYLSQNSYTESGANSLNLHVDSRQDQLIQSQAGLVFTTDYLCGPEHTSGTFRPRLEMSYINQVPLAKSDYETQFANSSCEFNVSGWNFLRNLGAVGLGFTYLSHSEKVGVSLQYDGQFGSKYWNQSGNLILDLKY